MPSKAISGCRLVAGRRRDGNPGGIEDLSGEGHARAVDVGRGRAQPVVLPDDEKVRAVERDRRSHEAVDRCRDDDAVGLQNLPGGGYRRAVDVHARARVLPADEIVRAVESERRRVLDVARGRDRDSGRIEDCARLVDACAVDVGVGKAGTLVAPGNEVVRAVEGNRRRVLTVCGRRDRDPTRVEHRPARADTGSVDVVFAKAPVLPRDEVVRSVEGNGGWTGERVVGHGRDRDPRRVEHHSDGSNARAIDVIRAARAAVLPGDKVVRTVVRDLRLSLVVGRCRDRDPFRVEHRSGRAHARAVDIGRRTRGAAVLPDDEVVRAVKGDRRARSRERPRRDCEARRIEHGSRRAHACAVDVKRARASVAPGDEVIRAVEGDDGPDLPPRSRGDRDPGRIENRSG